MAKKNGSKQGGSARGAKNAHVTPYATQLFDGEWIRNQGNGTRKSGMPLYYMERRGSFGDDVYVLPNCSDPARALRQGKRSSEGLRRLKPVTGGRETDAIADADMIALRFDAPDAFGGEHMVKALRNSDGTMTIMKTYGPTRLANLTEEETADFLDELTELVLDDLPDFRCTSTADRGYAPGYRLDICAGDRILLLSDRSGRRRYDLIALLDLFAVYGLTDEVFVGGIEVSEIAEGEHDAIIVKLPLRESDKDDELLLAS